MSFFSEEQEKAISLLLRLQFLPVQDRPDLGDYDASFEKLTLVGEFGALLLDEEGFREFMVRKVRIETSHE